MTAGAVRRWLVNEATNPFNYAFLAVIVASDLRDSVAYLLAAGVGFSLWIVRRNMLEVAEEVPQASPAVHAGVATAVFLVMSLVVVAVCALLAMAAGWGWRP